MRLGDVESLKPRMKALRNIADLKIVPTTAVMVKADGQFSWVVHSRDSGTMTVGIGGTVRAKLPCIAELREALLRQSFNTVEMLGELYAVDSEERMLQLPEVVTCLLKESEKIRLGLFDLLKINGKPVLDNYLWKLQEMQQWLQGCRLAYVLPLIQPKNLQETQVFWDAWVKGRNYEGLVARSNGETWKIKTTQTVDAIIIGVNKTERFFLEEVASLKLAVMDQLGRFIEVGDVTVPELELRKRLWELMKWKVSEDDKAVYVKPLIVVEVSYMETYEKILKRVLMYTDDRYVEVSKTPFISLRSPTLVRFRGDKKPVYRDASKEQLTASS